MPSVLTATVAALLLGAGARPQVLLPLQYDAADLPGAPDLGVCNKPTAFYRRQAQQPADNAVYVSAELAAAFPVGSTAYALGSRGLTPLKVLRAARVELEIAGSKRTCLELHLSNLDALDHWLLSRNGEGSDLKFQPRFDFKALGLEAHELEPGMVDGLGLSQPDGGSVPAYQIRDFTTDVVAVVLRPAPGLVHFSWPNPVPRELSLTALKAQAGFAGRAGALLRAASGRGAVGRFAEYTVTQFASGEFGVCAFDSAEHRGEILKAFFEKGELVATLWGQRLEAYDGDLVRTAHLHPDGQRITSIAATLEPGAARDRLDRFFPLRLCKGHAAGPDTALAEKLGRWRTDERIVATRRYVNAVDGDRTLELRTEKSDDCVQRSAALLRGKRVKAQTANGCDTLEGRTRFSPPVTAGQDGETTSYYDVGGQLVFRVADSRQYFSGGELLLEVTSSWESGQFPVLQFKTGQRW